MCDCFYLNGSNLLNSLSLQWIQGECEETEIENIGKQDLQQLWRKKIVLFKFVGNPNQLYK